MSVNWGNTLSKLSNFKLSIAGEAKRVLKKRVPKSEAIRKEIRDNILVEYNKFVNFISLIYSSLTVEQQYQVKKVFSSVRDKVIRSYLVLKVPYKVPTSCLKGIDETILDEDFEETVREDTSDSDASEESCSNSDSEEKDTKTVEIMAMSKMEFFNFASKIISNEFDGSAERLQPFLDALNLLQANCENQEQNAVAYVKTKLTGKARDLITETDTLGDIIVKLRTGVQVESSQMVTAKLLSLRQYNKDASKYASEVEVLAQKLKRAYITEGVPVPVAETYATNVTIKALKTNSNSDKIQLVMEAGTFNSCQEALTKFVNISSEATSSTVLFTKNYTRGGNRGQFRGRGNFANNNYRQNSNCGSPRSYQSNNDHGYQNNNYRRYNNQNYRGNQTQDFRGRRNQNQRGRQNPHIRYLNEDNSENQQDTQLGPMGLS